eukprot:6191963-Pleurochrysis_carterae.AAC.1
MAVAVHRPGVSHNCASPRHCAALHRHRLYHLLPAHSPPSHASYFLFPQRVTTALLRRLADNPLRPSLSLRHPFVFFETPLFSAINLFKIALSVRYSATIALWAICCEALSGVVVKMV